MNGLITIELKKMHFYANHGLYAEERKTGNEFEINLSVAFLPNAGTITSITETINYSSLYQLLKTEMQIPRQMLETFVMEMADLIHITFPQVKKLEISITKLHVPMAKFTGTAGVTYINEY